MRGKGLFRAQKERRPVPFVTFFYKEGMEATVRKEVPADTDPPQPEFKGEEFRRPCGKERHRECADENEDSEKNVSKQDRGDRAGERENAKCPVPIGTPLPMFILKRLPPNRIFHRTVYLVYPLLLVRESGDGCSNQAQQDTMRKGWDGPYRTSTPIG